MAIKTTKVHTTSDGKEFTDYAQAKRHETAQAGVRQKKRAQEHRLNQLRNVLLHPSVSGSSPMNLCLELLNKPELAEKLRDALNSVLNMHRNFAKKA